ncbi:MAG: hypothetical protein ACR2IK_15580 [Chloroflexota bacterium]
MHLHQFVSPRTVIGLFATALGSLTFACGPTVAREPTPVTADPFTVVRATSQAAYASGKSHLQRGELQAALVDFDTARTNDPGTRPEIEQALSQTIAQLAAQTPTAEPSPLPRPILVATASATGAAAAPAPRRTPAVAPNPTTSTPAQTGRSTSTSIVALATQAGASSALVEWRDPQGRFTLSAPDDWVQSQPPVSMFGTSVVQFRDPSAVAELDISVDSATRAVSPELYAAIIDIAMQQQVPGYAAEQTLPGSTAGNPSVHRVFTFTQRDAAGSETQARGFQVALVKGSTPYLISGSAPADQFSTFDPMFEQMLERFRFS